VTPSPTPAVSVEPNPATAYHGAPSANVIDLRNATPVPVQSVSSPEKEAEEPVSTAEAPKPVEDAEIAHTSEPATEGAPVIVNTAKASGRAERAAEIPQSDLIKRFPRKENTAPAVSDTPVTATNDPAPLPIPPEPAPLPTPPEPQAESANVAVSVSAPQPQPKPEPVSVPAGPIDGLTPAPASAEPTPPPPPAPAQIPTSGSLPPAVATQVDAMAKMVQSQAQQPAAVGPKPASVAALALTVALLGGYIWMKNYPNMALKVAASKAGVEAALPAYLPSSYNLDGPISYAPGQVSVKFTAPGGEPLTITQKRTNWDSQSLLENYVLKVSDEYLTVESQGLTIYFYDQNQATWVNRGVWYTLEGDTRLSREQLLKIIDSL
jgi:hypothetical protein